MLSASHPYGMWVPAFPQKTFLGWPDCSHQPERAVTSMAALEVLGAAGCEPGEAFVARHPQPTPSIPGESSGRSHVPAAVAAGSSGPGAEPGPG